MPQTKEGLDLELGKISDINGGGTPHSTADGGHTSSSAVSNVATDQKPDPEKGEGSQAASKYSKVQHKFLSKTAKIGYFLPTGTSMLFEAAVPKIYKNGQCSYTGRLMMWRLLALCVLICFFSQFTDSSKKVVTDSNNSSDKATDGKKKVVYQFVKRSEWDLVEDGVHILISVAAFLTMAFSDKRVVECVFPAHAKDVEEVMLSLEVIVLSVCSFLYFAFPVKRTGLVPKMEKKKKR